MKNVIFEANWGMNFSQACQQAKAKAIKIRNNELNFAIPVPCVEFEFNGIDILISHNTDLCNLERDYQNAWLMGWKKIGPNCKEYSQELIKEISEKQIKAEQEEKERAEKWRLEEENKRNKVLDKIKNVPFECLDPDKLKDWEKSNTDSYGGRIISYAKEWAKLMQIELNEGKELKDIAEKTSHEADYDGITGFMYGASVQVLTDCWKHGELLRKWHNKEYNHAGNGVVNPAILTIKTKQD